MRLSRQWLNEITPVKQTDTEVAAVFTRLGFECEHIESIGIGLDRIVTARILSVKPHPNADKLQLATVTDGTKQLEVVCGARNIAVGQVVPLAREGAVLPIGQKIEKANIRGVESRGMLCSGKELGLNDDHSGIWQIDQLIKPGTPLSLVLGLPDTVFDLNVAPNRPDCLSVVGLAQEYAAHTGLKLQLPLDRLKQSSTPTVKSITAKMVAQSACSHYALRYIADVKVATSPWWLQKRLIAGGIRPINSVVDAANYIMLLTGQPLHAFDADKVSPLKGKKTISVRIAKPNESIELLDGTKKTLTSAVTVIADSNRALAVAGVMGGADCAVTEQTRNVIIESAVFNPKAIRRSSQLLNIRTESSSRFEKGVDSMGTDTALDAVAALINAIGGGTVQRGIIYGAKAKPVKKVLRYQADEVSSLLGINITAANQIKILKSLGCWVTKSGRQLIVTTPSWRIDLAHMADLADEIGRHTGYNNIKPAYLTGTIKPVADHSKIAISRPIKARLARMGWDEMYNYTFYSADLAEYSGSSLNKHYALSNPLNPEQQYLRTSLVPRLLENIRHNSGRNESMKVFEIGTTFQPDGVKPKEVFKVSGAITTKSGNGEALLLEAKGIIEALLGRSAILAQTQSGQYATNDCDGQIRVWNEDSLKKLKISQNVISFEINLTDLSQLNSRWSYGKYSVFPSIKRDFSLIIPELVSFGAIVADIESINQSTITKAEPRGLILAVERVGEIYRDERIGSGKKNLTLRCLFQAEQRTLTGSEVEILCRQITDRLNTKLGVTLRSGSSPK
ncbi:MAG: phenylalanine--tRNA ligase subunit beta [Patescibacteria group bacterium]|jgi:phenylalanyl-tRNA synthetase beta chain